MKLILILIAFTTFAQAVEVSTDCPAMNGDREKIVKDDSPRKKKSSVRVSSQ